VSDDVQVGRLLIPAAELTWRYDTPGGPGGQHANRAATRVELRWDVQGSTSLDEADRGRLLAALGPAVVVTAADSRSQARNRDLAVERLRSVVGEALRPQRPRRTTKPSRAAKTRRLDAKRQRGEIKRNRGRVRPDD